MEFKKIRVKINEMSLVLHALAAIGGIALGLCRNKWQSDGGQYPNPVKYLSDQHEKRNNPRNFERERKINVIKEQRNAEERSLARDYRTKRKLLEKNLAKNIENAKASKKSFRVIMYLERNIETELDALRIDYEKNINSLYQISWEEISKINNEE